MTLLVSTLASGAISPLPESVRSYIDTILKMLKRRYRNPSRESSPRSSC
jgi:hypothetical protein